MPFQKMTHLPAAFGGGAPTARPVTRMTHVPPAFGGGQPAARPVVPEHGRTDVPRARPLPGSPIESRGFAPSPNGARAYPDVTPSLIGVARAYPTVINGAACDGDCGCTGCGSGGSADPGSPMPLIFCDTQCPPDTWLVRRAPTSEERDCLERVLVNTNDAMAVSLGATASACIGVSGSPAHRRDVHAAAVQLYIEAWMLTFWEQVAREGGCIANLPSCKLAGLAFESFGNHELYSWGCSVLTEEQATYNIPGRRIDEALDTFVIDFCVPRVWVYPRVLFNQDLSIGATRYPPLPTPVRRF